MCQNKYGSKVLLEKRQILVNSIDFKKKKEEKTFLIIF